MACVQTNLLLTTCHQVADICTSSTHSVPTDVPRTPWGRAGFGTKAPDSPWELARPPPGSIAVSSLIDTFTNPPPARTQTALERRGRGASSGGSTGRLRAARTGLRGSRAHDGVARCFRTGRSETVLALGTSLHSKPVSHVRPRPTGPRILSAFLLPHSLPLPLLRDWPPKSDLVSAVLVFFRPFLIDHADDETLIRVRT